MQWKLASLSVIVSLGLTAVADPTPPAFKFSDFQNKTDSATAEIGPGTALLRIKCPRGIGYATVKTKKGAWPERVTVLLEGMRELESFRFTTGRMHVEGSRKESGKFALYFLGNARDVKERSRVGTLDIRVEVRKNGIAVVFPERLFADAEGIRFAWIDWWRN